VKNRKSAGQVAMFAADAVIAGQKLTEAAAEFGVSREYIYKAKNLIASDPDKALKVRRGELQLYEAKPSPVRVRCHFLGVHVPLDVYKPALAAAQSAGLSMTQVVIASLKLLVRT
jgi:hypothetical protein